MSTVILTSVFMLTLFFLSYKQSKLIVITAATIGFAISSLLLNTSTTLTICLFSIAIVLTLLSITPLRRQVLGRPIFSIYKKILPAMSETERTALAAGTVGWDGELFAGKANWQRLMDVPKPTLSEAEQAFLDGPCNELASLIDSWEIDHELNDMPEKVWTFIKQHKFFGMIIPKQYGGLEFSAQAQSAVLQKLSLNATVSSTVGVPNSLGPGELLLKYGTQAQKDYYLPRLADGQEIPCFALTGPRAGSDATALPDTGIICKGQFEGQEIIGIKLNFSKRYITLAPVATVIGLAFRLFDPENLLGDKKDIGITCALVPRNTPNMQIGRRHFPTGSPFQNGPIEGKDVFIPVDWIIGGQDMAGQGWRMLVECLSVGRCITLPSCSTGGAKYAAATTGAYARIRRQFNVAISQLEGVQEAIARIAGKTYIATATSANTAAMLDNGEVPALPSAILKYHLTEIAREIALDMMDIHGGRAVMRGPRNYIVSAYTSVPVMITVEGANILTRSMIIFGQGATRCHPYVLKEMKAAEENNLTEFDTALFAHLGFFISNADRSLLMGLTGGKLTRSPVKGPTAKYYKKVNRYIANFALMVDAAMFSMGGALKFREMISARLGDLVANLYLTTMVLKHWENQGRIKDDLPLVDWSCQYLLARYETALDELLANLPNRPLAWLLRGLTLPYGRRAHQPADTLTRAVSDLITHHSDSRSRLIEGTYQGDNTHNPVAIYNDLLARADKATPLYKKIAHAVKTEMINADLLTIEDRIRACGKQGVLSDDQVQFMLEFEADVLAMLLVDDFDKSELEQQSSAQDQHANAA